MQFIPDPAPFGLLNTPFQRGADCGEGTANRFNGLPGLRKIVETVPRHRPSRPTPLKRGVTEIWVT